MIGAALAISAALTALLVGALRGAEPTSTSAPAAAPAVAEDGFALWGTDQHGEPLRWDACTPVRFVLSSIEAPVNAEDDLRSALAMLAGASGLDLVLEGTSDERPTMTRPLVEPDGDRWRWRPVLVAWMRPEDAAAAGLPLIAEDRGIAVPVAVRDGDRESFVTGQLVINAAREDLVAGFGDRATAVGATLVHELGHILGLDHVEDRGEMMSKDPGSGPVVLGPGDLAGLRTVGSAAGCNPAPPASAGRGLDLSR